MNYSQAKEEFDIRHFLWGKTEFEQEIRGGFPILQTFASGRFWRLHQFMRRLDHSESRLFTAALLKTHNPEAAKALNEDLIPDEEALHLNYRHFCLSLPISQTEESVIKKKLTAAKAGKFASKAKIRRAVLDRFKAAFGAKCFDLAVVGMDPALDFKMRHHGWIVTTHFDFQVRGRQFDYSHTIHSETRVPPHDLPAAILGFPGMTGWLGLKHSSEWSNLVDEDIQSTCDFIVQRCGCFFEVLPKMLKGLDFPSLTTD